ncbi:MAG: hypothetical protein PHP02_01365 [Eubacteriales bacterium]|nr:hypothetical protein [Eubacteriales bacterium]
MAGLDKDALSLKALLGGRGFIRRDRSRRALYVTDAPRLMGADAWKNTRARLNAAGYTHGLENGLAYISWDYPRSLAFSQALLVPEGWEDGEGSLAGFCRILGRHEGAFAPEMLPGFLHCLSLWDKGEEGALRREAEAKLAHALRERSPLPEYLLPLLLNLPERRTPC